MEWCIEVRPTCRAINEAIGEAATYGRELASAFPLASERGPGTARVILIFRPIPRGAPAYVTATIVDRNGYAR
jgi:hypothetical protein